jgi:hypothetical protein
MSRDEADVGLGLDQEGGRFALGGPREAALIERVVDPRQRAVRGVVVERLDVPVRGPEARPSVEVQAGQFAGQPEDQRQMVVGAVLPAGGPDEVVDVTQAQQLGTC